MTNPYYNHGSIPADNSPGSSSEIRAEFDSVATGFAKLPTLSGNGGKVVKVNSGGTAMEVKASDAEQADTVTAATAKTIPVDADYVGIVDSAASNVLKKLTFANQWTWIQSKLNGATAKNTPTGADTLPLSDSAASGATKTLSITNLGTYLAGLCSAGWNAATATTASACSGNSATATSATSATTSTTVSAVADVSSSLGYSSGGTYTQLTSKSTDVPITTRSGLVIMNNASLSGGASVSFNLTDDGSVSQGYLLIVENTYSANYSIRPSAELAGPTTFGRQITVKNETGGSLGNAVSFRYIYIKNAA